jgi:hypothetical protein
VTLVQALEEQLAPLRFKRLERPVDGGAVGVDVEAVWRRRTFNTNRAVALIRPRDHSTHPGEIAQAIKIPVGKQIGYFPFLYGLGLQVIAIGGAPVTADDLASYTDKIDNQRSIVQSIFAVHESRECFVSARTWGQFLSGKFQDAIEQALSERLTPC